MPTETGFSEVVPLPQHRKTTLHLSKEDRQDLLGQIKGAHGKPKG